jgi:hypothetical protein
MGQHRAPSMRDLWLPLVLLVTGATLAAAVEIVVGARFPVRSRAARAASPAFFLIALVAATYAFGRSLGP